MRKCLHISHYFDCSLHGGRTEHIRYQLAYGRSGNERLLLRIPARYGHSNQSAEAADKALYPKGIDRTTDKSMRKFCFLLSGPTCRG